MTTSRIPGFYKLSMEERRSKLDEIYHFSPAQRQTLSAQGPLPLAKVDKMVENAIGVYSLPFGVGLNFLINGRDYVVPMAIEEPSVIASASHIAKIVRDAGGFEAESTGRTMIGQVQVLDCPDIESAVQSLRAHEAQLIQTANALHPGMVRRGGGASRIQTRIIDTPPGSRYDQMLIVHLLVDTRDAMGANTIDTMVEAIAPLIERLTGGKAHLRILSNYTDDCLARSRCTIPPHLLTTGKFSGESVRDGIVAAYKFARCDIYRAATHNKGVMNGVDAVVIATGNDWRAIEAAAHAHASRFGFYGPMTEWSVDDKGNLVGAIELPMPVGTVGGSIKVHPMAQLAHKLLGVQSAEELAMVIVAVGLAQNLGALKALATDGIQKGHMALHARSVAMTAGAEGDLIDVIAKELVKEKDFRVDTAKQLMESLN